MSNNLIPEIYLKNKDNNPSKKYRLAYEWKDKVIVVCIPKNGDEPYTIKLNKDEIHSIRIYRR